MSGQSAMLSRKEVAATMKKIEATPKKTAVGSGGPIHADDHYNKRVTKEKGIK